MFFVVMMNYIHEEIGNVGVSIKVSVCSCLNNVVVLNNTRWISGLLIRLDLCVQAVCELLRKSVDRWWTRE